MNINNGVNMANSVFVRDEADYILRKRYQTQALAETYALLSMVDIAYRTYSLETARVEYWTRLIYDVQNLVRNWRKVEIEKHDKEAVVKRYWWLRSPNVGNANNIRNVNPSGALNNNNANNTNGVAPDCVNRWHRVSQKAEIRALHKELLS